MNINAVRIGVEGVPGGPSGEGVALSDLRLALRDFKYLLDIQRPGALRSVVGVDARETQAYRRAAYVLVAFDGLLDRVKRGNGQKAVLLCGVAVATV